MVSSTAAPARAPIRHHKAIKFSLLEQRLIDLLQEADGRPLSTHDLVGKYWPGPPNAAPLNARTLIVGRLRGIAAKAERAALPWRIRKTKRSGPNPQSFWIVKA